MRVETKVGVLFLVTFGLVIGFAFSLGAMNPFNDSKDIYLAYNFAGGIEVGSPLRVMGIKVGKVKSIDFVPDQKMPNGEEVKLRLKISIEKKAWESVREDSKFFINLAGVIGEKYIEVSPGSIDKAPLKEGQTYRGEDPPRIDQLISQSYSLAGKILEMVQDNEADVTQTLKMLNQLVTNVNKTLTLLDKTTKNADITKLLQNLVVITNDISAVSGKLKTPQAEKTYDLLHRLIWRLDDLDKAAIKKFLQEEGIKAKLF